MSGFTGKKIKILCLHGQGQNKAVMKYQMRGLQTLLGDRAEFIYVNGGIPVAEENVHPAIKKCFGDAPMYDNVVPCFEEGQAMEGEIPWVMWPYLAKDQKVRVVYRHKEVAIKRILDTIKSHGPIDILLGFSQGGVVINMLTAYLEKKFPGRPLPWKFNILYSSYCIRDDKFRDEYMQAPLKQPSICVVGRQDPHCKLMLSVPQIYQNATLLQHNEGHRVPKDKMVTQQICNEILRRCGFPAVNNRPDASGLMVDCLLAALSKL